jgi:UDP-N-acetylmuramoyl-tripeptide--D-alanyl-D-alanine ligase
MMNNNLLEALYKQYQQHRVVTTDSRHVVAGALFFALKGDNFDGNQYANQALAQGAAVAIVDNPTYCTDTRCILVDNSLVTLQQLAQYHRQKLNIPIVAVAGSNGKTTTKELLKAVLSTTFVTHATAGNLNNHIGVPLTLLAMPSDTEIAVIEIGANHPNEITELCQIAQPNCGLVTNIGKEHLEGFGDIEGVQKAEGELYDYLAQHNGLAFVNTDDSRVLQIAEQVPQKHRYTVQNNPADTKISVDASGHFLVLQYEQYRLETQLIGQYNASNVAAALVVGKHFGVSVANAIQAIAAYIPQNKRSQVLQWQHNTVILDAYNANPSSMEAALQSFAALQVSRKMVILGDMREVGQWSLQEHQLIVDYLQTIALEKIVLVGEEFAKTQFPAHFQHFSDPQLARQWLHQSHLEGYHILLKASRGIALEQLLAENL